MYMKTRRMITLLLALVLLASLSVPACADNAAVPVTLQSGDTVYGICMALGLDYSKCISCIMKLNGFARETDLANVKAGATLLFPTKTPEVVESAANVVPAAAPVATAAVTADEVEYYIIPYKMQEGDYLAAIYRLWGLDYEEYLDAIIGLNHIENLDNIHIGKLLYLPTTKSNLQNDNYVAVLGHVMQPGESAYSVITAYGFDYYQMEAALIKYNFGADMTRLQVGQKLFIPLI